MNKQIVIAIAFFLLGLSLALAQTVTTAANNNALIADSSVEYDLIRSPDGTVIVDFEDTSAAASLAPFTAAILSALF
jgi:hypothetical protein